jgi:hypothetical protein
LVLVLFLLLKLPYLVDAFFLFTLDMDPAFASVAADPVLAVHIGVQGSFLVDLVAIAAKLVLFVTK